MYIGDDVILRDLKALGCGLGVTGIGEGERSCDDSNFGNIDLEYVVNTTKMIEAGFSNMLNSTCQIKIFLLRQCCNNFPIK